MFAVLDLFIHSLIFLPLDGDIDRKFKKSRTGQHLGVEVQDYSRDFKKQRKQKIKNKKS